MKVLKSCSEVVPDGSVSFSDIAVGTVFRYGDLKCGPYLKLGNGQMLNFFNNSISATAIGQSLSNYKPLPNAALVTGEEV